MTTLYVHSSSIISSYHFMVIEKQIILEKICQIVPLKCIVPMRVQMTRIDLQKRQIFFLPHKILLF